MPSILKFITILFGFTIILTNLIIFIIDPTIFGVILFIIGFLIIFAGLIFFNNRLSKINFQPQNSYQNNFNNASMSNNFKGNNFKGNTNSTGGIIIIFLGIISILFSVLIGIILLYVGVKILINSSQQKFKTQPTTSSVFENNPDGFEDETIPSNTTITNYFGRTASTSKFLR